MANNLDAWIQPSKVTAFNKSIDNCSPLLMHCSFSRAWPAVTYSNGATAMTTTSPAGRTTTYQMTAGKISRIIDPDGNIVQDISYYPSSDISRQHLVRSVTRGGATWSYNPTPPLSAAGTMTMVATNHQDPARHPDPAERRLYEAYL